MNPSCRVYVCSNDHPWPTPAELFALSDKGKEWLQRWRAGEEMELVQPKPLCLAELQLRVGDVADEEEMDDESDLECEDVRAL